MAWDVVLNIQNHPTSSILNKQKESELLNIIIYPQHLPNAAPESWITHRPDLQCICSHSSIIGWTSNTSFSSSSKGKFFENVEGSGLGGLQSHVDAVNDDRKRRGLEEVVSLDVDGDDNDGGDGGWPEVCKNRELGVDDHVLFLEDDVIGNNMSASTTSTTTTSSESSTAGTNYNSDNENSSGAIGHYRIPHSSLYNSVAVGGTFDGVHYGHRKLLTLAISSVLPNTGKLIIGITTDEMLQQKEYAEYIPPLKQRIQSVRDFVDDLAPGMKNRVKIVPIKDKYGPPGTDPGSNVYEGIENDFDALVLSHETLPTGNKLNQYRVDVLGMKPLMLLCTRRTEAYGMSSTTLRRIRSQQ